MQEPWADTDVGFFFSFRIPGDADRHEELSRPTGRRLLPSFPVPSPPPKCACERNQTSIKRRMDLETHGFAGDCTSPHFVTDWQRRRITRTRTRRTRRTRRRRPILSYSSKIDRIDVKRMLLLEKFQSRAKIVKCRISDVKTQSHRIG